MVQIGVFYDGGFFAHLSEHFLTRSVARSRPTIAGVHDAIRWYASHALRTSLADCEVEAHYVRGRLSTASTTFDAVLAANGVTRHDVPMNHANEEGVDVYLALEAFDRAITTPLDLVALITGDADLVPLVERLRRRDVRVLVPTVDARHAGAGLHTAPRLAEAASDAPTYDDLFAPGTDATNGLVFPFESDARQPAPTTSHYRHGVITRWTNTSGFITEAGTGQSWFVSQDSTPGGSGMAVGTRVTFAGKVAPRPGKRYPEAFSVTAAADR